MVAPLAYPFQTGQFDIDFYDSKAVVLRIDNSVQSLPVLRNSKLAQLGGGKNLLATGDDTVWGTRSPVRAPMRRATNAATTERQPAYIVIE